MDSASEFELVPGDLKSTWETALSRRGRITDHDALWTECPKSPARVLELVAFLGVRVSRESTGLHPKVIQLASV